MERTRKLTAGSLEKFRRNLMMEEKSALTIAQYMRDVQAFFQFLPGGKQLDKEQAISYKAHLISAYHSIGTVNTKLAALNKFFSVMGLDGCKVKLLKAQRVMFQDRNRELTRAEYLRLLEAAREKSDTRLLLIMQTICSTGIRVSELRFITAQAVKLNRVEVTAKGKARKIFLPAKLRKILLAYLRKKRIGSGPVFTTRTGQPVDRSNLWGEMKRLCAAAGVERTKVFPHNLRHLFAREFYAVKKDIFHLADILGHSSVETTRIYTVTSGCEHEYTMNTLGLIL